MCGKAKTHIDLVEQFRCLRHRASLSVPPVAPCRGLCEYTREWVEHVPEEPVAAQLLDGCAWLHNPIALEVGPGVRADGGG